MAKPAQSKQLRSLQDTRLILLAAGIALVATVVFIMVTGVVVAHWNIV